MAGDTTTAERPKLITAAEAAAICSCTPKHIRSLCRDGKIKAVKLGATWRINYADLLQICGLSD